MRAAILQSGILLALILGPSAATAQTELFFATGVDSTGWAQAQSNADGHVLIESPQYPRGLWLHLVDEAGDALAGLQVEYQGRPDSLVAIRCVDLVGGMREMLVWTRSEGDPLRLTLKPRETSDLPAGLIPIDWHIVPDAEFLLESVEETRLIGWEAVAAFLQQHWQGQTGQVAMQFDTGTSFAIELDRPEITETLVAHLQQQVGASPIFLKAQVFKGELALLEGAILSASLLEDSKLEWAVRQVLGRLQGFITLQEAASLTRLKADTRRIHSLAGLEHFTALQELALQRNYISDVGPLAALTNLQSLNLWNNQITDVSPLAALTNLQSLNLRSNHQIADVSPLAALTNLQSLDLQHSNVDVSPLAVLTNLQSLNLWGSQITDVSPLAALTNLQSLYLPHTQITDVSPLASLANLQSLNLEYTQVTDVGPLAHLTNLQSLNLEYNYQITDVSPLAALTNLQSLNLRSNQIVDVSPLAHLTNLQSLNLGFNRIIDLSPLIHLTNLQSLYLKGNPLSDQARNEQIPILEERGVQVEY